MQYLDQCVQQWHIIVADMSHAFPRRGVALSPQFLLEIRVPGEFQKRPCNSVGLTIQKSQSTEVDESPYKLLTVVSCPATRISAV
jgi:hypothetical protein